MRLLNQLMLAPGRQICPFLTFVFKFGFQITHKNLRNIMNFQVLCSTKFAYITPLAEVPGFVHGLKRKYTMKTNFEF